MKLEKFLAAVALTLHFTGAMGQAQVSLEQVVALALENNYDVKLSINLRTAAEMDESLIIGAFLPQVNAVASTTWNATHQVVEFSDESRNNEGDVKSNNVNASIQLSWLLFDGMRMFATKKRIEEIAAQGELVVKGQMVNTVADVIAAYYNVVRSKQQIRAILEQMGVSEERVKLAETRLQVGTGGKPELLQAKVDLNAFRTQILTQETLVGRFKEELRGLVGMELPQSFDVADTIIIDLNLRKDTLTNDIDNKNYELLVARKNVEIAGLITKERRGEQYPFLSFNSNYNFTRNENTVAINNFAPLNSQSRGLNYGLSVSLPLLNNFRIKREIKQADLNLTRQEIAYDLQRATVNVQLEASFINYENAKKVLIIEEENILLARENVFIALEGFKRGIITSIELRTAQQSMADAYFRLINARYVAKLAETELLRLNGGLLR
jgi:outer membrane protein TolC